MRYQTLLWGCLLLQGCGGRFFLSDENCLTSLDCGFQQICQAQHCVASPGPCSPAFANGDCPAGQLCSQGVCVRDGTAWCDCEPPQGCLNGSCVAIDSNNSCSALHPQGVCPGEAVCVLGVCNTITDENTCSSTRPAGLCPSGSSCVDGRCLPTADVPCDAAHPVGRCSAGYVCDNGVCNPLPCSLDAPFGVCDPGLFCSAIGSCIAEGQCASTPDCLIHYNHPFDICSGGNCIRDFGCASQDECMAGEICSVIGQCIAEGQCRGAIDCGTGQFCSVSQDCIDVGTCNGADDCDAGQFCTASHACQSGQCQVTEDCAPGHICQSNSCVVSGQLCTTNTFTSLGCAPTEIFCCPSGETCCPEGQRCGPDGVCFANGKCVTDADCLTGFQHCQDFVCVPNQTCADNTGCDPSDYCSAAGGCIPDNSCSTNADCPLGEVCNALFECVPGQGCGTNSFEPELVKPNMLILLDRSGSMSEGATDTSGACSPGVRAKWLDALDAIDQVTTAQSTNIRFGVAMYPVECGGLALCGVGESNDCDCDGDCDNDCSNNCGGSNNCTPPTQADVLTGDFPIGINPISGFLARRQPGGHTPTGASLNEIAGDREAFGLPLPVAVDPVVRDNYVLLVTDGEPYCGGSLAASTVLGPLDALRALNPTIETFVVGFDFSTPSDNLNCFAQHGGHPRVDQCPSITDGNCDAQAAACYYEASDTQSLVDAFNEILGTVASCSYLLDPPPPNTDLMFVYLRTPTGDLVRLESAGNWSYNLLSQQITFLGASCNNVLAGHVPFIVYGCDTGG